MDYSLDPRAGQVSVDTTNSDTSLNTDYSKSGFVKANQSAGDSAVIGGTIEKSSYITGKPQPNGGIEYAVQATPTHNVKSAFQTGDPKYGDSMDIGARSGSFDPKNSDTNLNVGYDNSYRDVKYERGQLTKTGQPVVGDVYGSEQD